MIERKRLDREPIRARDIGMGRKNKSTPYIRSVCLKCGKERWIKANRPTSKGFTGLCKACSDTGGKRRRYKDDGYWFIPIKPDDFYFSMANNQGYIQEHRYLMAQYLGRILDSSELVHHKNNIKDDNRIENFELLSGASAHMYIHRNKERQVELREKIARRVSKSVECREWGCLTRKVQLDYLEIADEILALIPDIEEVEGYWKRIIKGLFARQKVKIEEAKREERERIIKWLKRHLVVDTKGQSQAYLLYPKDWQALGEK